jgi:IclR family acetate operon transcriptional repressor
MAGAGGEMGISELAEASGLPHPTIHRLLRTLVDLDYVRQRPSRRYELGLRLVSLGEKARDILAVWARPSLARLVEETGETANLSLLEGDELVYVAQVPSQNQMRMWIEVGLRVLPHSTGAGKALLAQLRTAEARAIIERTGLPVRTQHTIADLDAFMAELEVVRQRGYAVDDEEHELGVRCIAVALAIGPAYVALSVSGPASRLDTNVEPTVAATMVDVAANLSKTFDGAISW